MTEFQRLGVETTFDLASRPLDAVLVFSGTRELGLLRKCRHEKIRIVQRLDGINWMHRISPRALRHFLRAEAYNLLLRVIRSSLADRIIYQSQFSRNWWENWFGAPGVEACVINNGVPLDDYIIRKDLHDGTLLIVEGALPHDEYLKALLAAANRQLVNRGPLARMQIMGSVDSAWEGEWIRFNPIPTVAGLRPYAEVRASQAQAAIFLSIEPNPPCPNAVIEAMAAGLPVIGFDTGSLRDLVGRGGEVVTFEGDPWRLEIPRNLEEIGEAGRQVFANWASYSQAARMEAEARFDIRETARAYCEVLKG